MKFYDFLVVNTYKFAHFCVSVEEFLDPFKLRKRLPNLVEYFQEFVISFEIVTGDLKAHKNTGNQVKR